MTSRACHVRIWRCPPSPPITPLTPSRSLPICRYADENDATWYSDIRRARWRLMPTGHMFARLARKTLSHYAEMTSLFTTTLSLPLSAAITVPSRIIELAHHHLFFTRYKAMTPDKEMELITLLLRHLRERRYARPPFNIDYFISLIFFFRCHAQMPPLDAPPRRCSARKVGRAQQVARM